MTHPHLRVVPANGQIEATANEPEPVPRWCVRVCQAVGRDVVAVVAYDGDGYYLTRVTCPPYLVGLYESAAHAAIREARSKASAGGASRLVTLPRSV